MDSRVRVIISTLPRNLLGAAAALVLLGALGTGRIVGVDSYLEQTETVKKMPALKYLLG